MKKRCLDARALLQALLQRDAQMLCLGQQHRHIPPQSCRAKVISILQHRYLPRHSRRIHLQHRYRPAHDDDVAETCWLPADGTLRP